MEEARPGGGFSWLLNQKEEGGGERQFHPHRTLQAGVDCMRTMFMSHRAKLFR